MLLNMAGYRVKSLLVTHIMHKTYIFLAEAVFKVQPLWKSTDRENSVV